MTIIYQKNKGKKMGLKSTISRIFRGKVHDINESLENINIETVSKQAIRDMKRQLNKSIKTVSNCLAEHKNLKEQHSEFTSNEIELSGKINRAVENNNDELARELIIKRIKIINSINGLKESIDMSKKSIDKLMSQIDSLKINIRTAEHNQVSLIARLNAAKIQKQAIKVASGFDDGKSAMSVFKRLEERVKKDENVAYALDEISKRISEVDDETDIDELVNNELEKIKNKK